MSFIYGGTYNIVPYSRNVNNLSDDKKKQLGQEDLKNLVLINYFKCGISNLKFHFPRKDIHSMDYYEAFVKFVLTNIYDGTPVIDDEMIASLFDTLPDQLNELGISNDEKGIDRLKTTLKFSTFSPKPKLFNPSDDSISFATDATFFDSSRKRHEFTAFWEMRDDLSIHFVDLWATESNPLEIK